MKSRAGQSAVEFLVLAGIMFLFFAITIVYVQDLLVQFTQGAKEQQLYGVRDAIVNEIGLANRMPAGYERHFELPTDIQGLGYSITIEQDTPPLKDALVITTLDASTIVYLDYDVTVASPFKPGWNMIRRAPGIIVN